jgi:hypothetical protein
MKANRSSTLPALAFAVFLLATATLIGLTISETKAPDYEVATEQPLEPLVITTEDAIKYIEEGEAILILALDVFTDNPTRSMGSTLLQITDEYNHMLGGLCQVPGTDVQCKRAIDTIVASYDRLVEQAKKLSEQQP